MMTHAQMRGWNTKLGRSGRRVVASGINTSKKEMDGNLQTKKMTSGSKGKASGKGKGQGTGVTETRHCYDCGQQGHLVLNCLCRWANNIEDIVGQHE